MVRGCVQGLLGLCKVGPELRACTGMQDAMQWEVVRCERARGKLSEPMGTASKSW